MAQRARWHMIGRGFRAWVDCDDRYGRSFCLVRCKWRVKHSQQCLYTVSTLSTRRFKNVGSPEKSYIVLSS
jgi:hypothetical protein